MIGRHVEAVRRHVEDAGGRPFDERPHEKRDGHAADVGRRRAEGGATGTSTSSRGASTLAPANCNGRTSPVKGNRLRPRRVNPVRRSDAETRIAAGDTFRSDNVSDASGPFFPRA